MQNSPHSGGLKGQWGKEGFVPVLPCQEGEHKRPPLLRLGPLLHLPVGPTNSASTFSSVLNTVTVVFFKELWSVDKNWHGLLGSHPKD